MDLADRMIRRAVQICPELTNGKGLETLEAVRHVAGLRPAPDGGPRLEKRLIRDLFTQTFKG